MISKCRTDKNTRILILYHLLKKGIHVEKETFIVEHGINGRTFDRDIQDLRLFLSEIFSYEEILYDRTTRSYYLGGAYDVAYMDKTEAIMLMKVLLDSKVFRKDEMEGLMDSVLSVMSKPDKEFLLSIFRNECNEYKSEEKKAIIKITRDLFFTMHDGNDIEVEFWLAENQASKMGITPIKIDILASAFYLIGKKMTSESEIVTIPINSIICFKKL